MTIGVGGSSPEEELRKLTSQRDSVAPIGQAERHFQAQHAGRAQFQRVGLDARRDQRHAREVALRHVVSLRIDDHPFAIIDVFAHQAGCGQRGLSQRDAGAGLDGIQVEFGEDGHGMDAFVQRDVSHGARRLRPSLRNGSLKIRR